MVLLLGGVRQVLGPESALLLPVGQPGAQSLIVLGDWLLARFSLSLLRIMQVHHLSRVGCRRIVEGNLCVLVVWRLGNTLVVDHAKVTRLCSTLLVVDVVASGLQVMILMSVLTWSHALALRQLVVDAGDILGDNG